MEQEKIFPVRKDRENKESLKKCPFKKFLTERHL